MRQLAGGGIGSPVLVSLPPLFPGLVRSRIYLRNHRYDDYDRVRPAGFFRTSPRDLSRASPPPSPSLVPSCFCICRLEKFDCAEFATWCEISGVYSRCPAILSLRRTRNKCIYRVHLSSGAKGKSYLRLPSFIHPCDACAIHS